MTGYIIFASFVLFVVIPALFYFENKENKKDNFNRHVESTIGMWIQK